MSATGVLPAQRLLGAGLARASVAGLNACYGNTVMLGIPTIPAASTGTVVLSTAPSMLTLSAVLAAPR